MKISKEVTTIRNGPSDAEKILLNISQVAGFYCRSESDKFDIEDSKDIRRIIEEARTKTPETLMNEARQLFEI